MKVSPTYQSLLYSLSIVVIAMMISACVSKPTVLSDTMPDRAERVTHGYLYYLDGAGGGTSVKNWAGGVMEGFIQAGYRGAGEMFSWGKGNGLTADQKASVEYKRKKAEKLTMKIERYSAVHPGKPVGVLGFSAGTAQVIYALEMLPDEELVDTVVLLGTSVSDDYDLTEMLKRIRGKIYVYTSTRDLMVGVFMKFSGSADRKYLDDGAHIHGFVLPEGANEETRKLYAEKIVTIKWSKEFENDGNNGRHFDNIKMEFIRDQVAPLFMGMSVPGIPD